MAVPYTRLQALKLLLQIERNLNGLQFDFRANATTWKAAAQAQSIPRATLESQMNSAAAAYQERLGWLGTLQANGAVWSVVADLWTTIGGTGAEFNDLMTPFNAVANGLGPADKSTYAKIVTACNQILATIDAPPSLWPE
ncbi:MAG TPA: hypothetical protein PLR37_02290 [Candidatus Accumulibacter phosphatis]|nr:hypothetical protein [Candidatus Accumulibacter phosphatis]